MGKIYGYARVSTKNQRLDRQIKNIEDYCKDKKIEQIYREKYTGTKMGRPQFQKLLAVVCTGDTIIFDSVWGTRGQYFWDGNKRTSLMLANKILISAGAGIMTITDKYMEQFNVLLLEYYNTGKSSELKRFLYDNAIRHTW